MSPEDIIRELVAETNALPRHELPGTVSWAWNHPGIMSHRTKSPDRYDRDMRRVYFLEEFKKRAPQAYRSSPELLRAGLPSEREALRSPYQPYGADAPLMNTARWVGSLPAAVYATGQMAANEFDPEAPMYPEAYDDFAKNMNNFLGFLPIEPFGVNKNQMRDMVEMRAAQDRDPWYDIEIPTSFRDKSISTAWAERASPKGGKEYLADGGFVGPAYSVLGAVMDATVDPLMVPAKSLGGFAVDYGLGTMHGTVPAAFDAASGIRSLLGRGNAMAVER